VSKISCEPLADPLAQIELDFHAQALGGHALGEGMSLKSLLIEREKTLGIGPEGSLAAQIESAIAHARTMIESPVCPIVAVLGMLNAGKSLSGCANWIDVWLAFRVGFIAHDAFG
jgi:hypothetical protein